LRERPVDVRYKVELGRPRLHDKLFIIDNTAMIMGGRNLEQDFFGVGCRLYVDIDFLVTGEPVPCASRYYNQRWQECVSAQPRLSGEEAKKMLKKQVHKHWNSMSYEDAYCEIDCWLSQLSASPLMASNLPCRERFPMPDQQPCSMEFLHDCVGGSKQDSAAISQRIFTSLRQAKRSIQLSTPYFVISNELQDILRDASHRGVSVTILTNSLESTDQVVAHAGYANQRRFLVRHGIQVLEYQGNRPLHAKMILIDGHTTILGSHNLDMLSEKRNSEVAMLVRDPAFAVQANEVYRSFVRGSDRVERGELFRLEARESDASNEKRKEFQKLRIVAPFIKRYL
jgi:cardiolipin synthase C